MANTYTISDLAKEFDLTTRPSVPAPVAATACIRTVTAPA